MVYCAYETSHRNPNIRSAFITNSNNGTVVEDYELDFLVDEENFAEALKIVRDELKSTEVSLKKLNRLLTHMEKSGVTNDDPEKMNGRISARLKEYAELVDAYRSAENDVRSNIEDFTTLCADFMNTFREYEMLLVDIFGKGIKEVWPELFDFKNRFLNIDKMFKHNLMYNQITDKCMSLIRVLPGNFSSTISKSISGYRSSEAKGLARKLASDMIEMIKQYEDDPKLKEIITADTDTGLRNFQDSIKTDIEKIKGDMEKWQTVYVRNLRDVILPNIKRFIDDRQVLLNDESDLKKIIERIYDDDEISQLNEDRQEILDEIQKNDDDKNDHEQNIDIFSAQEEDIKMSLEYKKEVYKWATKKEEEVMRQPLWLIKTLPFFKKEREQREKWEKSGQEFVRTYESLDEELKESKNNREEHENGKKEAEKTRQNLNCDLERSKSRFATNITSPKRINSRCSDTYGHSSYC